MILETPATRAERIDYLAAALDGLYAGPPVPASTVGGRAAALEQLRAFEPQNYGRMRNHVVRRSVSALSAYIRHGVLSLTELRDYVVTRFAPTPGVNKFINELAWRAFWQLVYADLGERIHADLEPAKHTAPRQRGLPPDIASGTTGLVCIDAALQELFATGYMHNHARMWVAAYVQHWRGVDWRDGAALFYRHLLDGDPASNSLSWQWVGSTFSAKPYFFNRQNVEQYSDGVYCSRCPLATSGCPFDASYEQLAVQLFGEAIGE
jgi:deoxyribodipyrimidine photo-lyase family protein (cryptochrome)